MAIRSDPPEPVETSLTPAEYESLAAFRFALRRFMRFSEDAARAAGLTPHQHQALLAIKGFPGAMPNVGSLAEQLLIAPHSAAELVLRLDAAGLVDKVADATDRRRVGLRLTERADRALLTLTRMHLREVRVLAPRLTRIFDTLETASD